MCIRDSYQSSYYYIGHFSRFILPGDKIINSISLNNNIDVLSSISADENTIHTVIQNRTEKSIDLNYNREELNSTFTIPARSIITVVDSMKNKK